MMLLAGILFIDSIVLVGHRKGIEFDNCLGKVNIRVTA